jgi:hypothetical protein
MSPFETRLKCPLEIFLTTFNKVFIDQEAGVISGSCALSDCCLLSEVVAKDGWSLACAFFFESGYQFV